VGAASQGDRCGEESRAEEGAVGGTELKDRGRGALREGRRNILREAEEGQESGVRGQEETVAKQGREVSERRLENVSLNW